MNLHRNEAAIIRSFCTAFIAKGYTVSIDDGVEEVLVQSTDINAILKESNSTGDDLFKVYKGDNLRGTVYCIYNNGNAGLDLISDTSDSLEEMLVPTGEFIDSLEDWNQLM